MAELNINLDTVKHVCLTKKNNPNDLTYAKGVDFPNGTKWRKPINLLTPTAPAIDCTYVRGNATSLGTEHTGLDRDQITKTVRWNDTNVYPIINMPSGWTSNKSHRHDSITVDPSDTNVSYVANGTNCERGTNVPLICISGMGKTTNGTKFAGYLEIYNPGLRRVCWDIIDVSTGSSVGASIISSWSPNPQSTFRSIGPLEKKKITFTGSNSFLFNGSTIKKFCVKVYDWSKAASLAGYTYEQSDFSALGAPFHNSECSEPFQLATSGTASNPTLCGTICTGMPVHIDYYRYDERGDEGSTRFLIKNPWSVNCICNGIYTAIPQSLQNTTVDVGTGTALKTNISISANDWTSVTLKPDQFEIYLSQPFQYFILEFNICTGPRGARRYLAFPRRAYPVAVALDGFTAATGKGGKGGSCTLNIYLSDPYEDDGSTSYNRNIVGPATFSDSRNAQGHLYNRAMSCFSPCQMKISFTGDCTDDAVHISLTTEHYNNYYADVNQGYPMSEEPLPITTEFSLTPIKYLPSVQSASQVDSYESEILVSNDNDYEVYCSVRVLGMSDWVDPATGKTVRREGSSMTMVRRIEANTSKAFNFIFDDSQGAGEVEYTTFFFHPERYLPTTAVTGCCS